MSIQITILDILDIKEEKTSELISKRINELDGDTWLKYSISVWNDIPKSSEELKLDHPAIFPKELPKRIIQMFLTRKQTEILDPFMGVGSTLLAAKELDKHGVGFEISEEYVKIAKERIESQLSLFGENIPQTIYIDDARNMEKYLEPESIDLCITSPPYWNILNEKRTADQKSIRNYFKKDGNLGEICDYDIYLQELKGVFEKVFNVLKKNSYCVVIIMDVRKKNKYYSLHMDIAKFMQEIGFILDDIIIWDRKREYNNLRPLGYPFVFRINKIHEYIMIFLKP